MGCRASCWSVENPFYIEPTVFLPSYLDEKPDPHQEIFYAPRSYVTLNPGEDYITGGGLDN